MSTVYMSLVKPFFDTLAAAILLLFLSPFVLLTILALLLFNKGKVWFVQPRPGKNGQIFRLIKFKTMNDDRDKEGKLLPDEKRLTWIGKIIRKTSLDELPQLLNVLAGDMSLIGPRPLLPDYLPLYSTSQARRHLVKPGITGWAQVNGRNAIAWDEKFRLDVYYVDNISFYLDLRILLKTVGGVLSGRGVSSGTSATMERFLGNPGNLKKE